MGDAADAILDGDFCQECGSIMVGGNGCPRTCNECLRAFANRSIEDALQWPPLSTKDLRRKKHMDTGKADEGKP